MAEAKVKYDPFISHYKNWEMLLIRTGQRLFQDWRRSGRSDSAIEAAMESVWQAKRLYREEIRRGK